MYGKENSRTLVLLLLLVPVPWRNSLVGSSLKQQQQNSQTSKHPHHRFVFFACLPCTVFRALATHPLLELDWTYVAAFLLLRVANAALFVPVTLALRGDIADYLVHYLGSTWVDTIIFGVPIITALYGSDMGNLYPVLAAMSSFVFQLPYMLICFEVGKAHREHKAAERLQHAEQQEHESQLMAADDGTCNNTNAAGGPVAAAQAEPKEVPLLRRIPVLKIVLRVIWHVLTVPPLVGIIIGMCYSLTGWSVPSLLDQTLVFFANCVTPVVTFAVGIFLVDLPFLAVWKTSTLYVFYKLVVMPALMIPVLYLMHHTVTGSAANIAVVLASLPLAFPAFTLAKQYGLGEREMSTCVAAGTLLMLPTVMAWIALLDAVDFHF
eukprot:TRINITY_DN2988_c0_g1_i2.p1 TRINITY_DN2988_c0_g1~~TRINITY_DN2988_c0_g1_i2.p1  ORF type:complete len:379 (-),score=112.80 TRINITY_DN2988_c0_g1_i2:92-1228(-)